MIAVNNNIGVWVPAPWMKKTTLAEFESDLRAYPRQLMNTREAFGGLTWEFKPQNNPNGGVCTSLSELDEAFGATKATLALSDAIVQVSREGKEWKITGKAAKE